MGNKKMDLKTKNKQKPEECVFFSLTDMLYQKLKPFWDHTPSISQVLSSPS